MKKKWPALVLMLLALVAVVAMTTTQVTANTTGTDEKCALNTATYLDTGPTATPSPPTMAIDKAKNKETMALRIESLSSTGATWNANNVYVTATSPSPPAMVIDENSKTTASHVINRDALTKEVQADAAELAQIVILDGHSSA